jgi:[lysine-biosynthesis-protein LysW]--L-2-aminoadipate ligase
MIRAEEKSLVEAARRRGLEPKLIDARKLHLELDGRFEDRFPPVVLQRCVSYFRHIHLTACLEDRGVKVVNSLKAALITGNKLLTSLRLVRAGVPTPRTMVAFSSQSALEGLKELGYPAVIKPVVGSWGRLVAPVKDPDTAQALLEDREHMFPLYQIYYFQEMVRRPPRDIRAVVIGDQVVAAIYRVSAGAWKTNTALGGRAENCPVTPELEEVCLKAVEAIGESGIFGVDCMEDEEGRILVHEVNNNIEFRNTVPATGVDIPGLMVQYLVEQAR